MISWSADVSCGGLTHMSDDWLSIGLTDKRDIWVMSLSSSSRPDWACSHWDYSSVVTEFPKSSKREQTLISKPCSSLYLHNI